MQAAGRSVESFAVAKHPLTAEGLANRTAARLARVKSTLSSTAAVGLVTYKGRGTG
jgi:hypothetical protein